MKIYNHMNAEMDVLVWINNENRKTYEYSK